MTDREKGPAYVPVERNQTGSGGAPAFWVNAHSEEGNSMNDDDTEAIFENLKFWALVLAAIGLPWSLIYMIL